MPEDIATHRQRGKMWTYGILAVLILLGAIVANVVFHDTDRAKNGVSHFLGLPSWILAAVAFVVGAGVFWLGLKVEADWPEFVGAALISGSIATFEMVFGWQHFELGLVVLPYVIPVAVFVVLLLVGLRKSV
jgi:hypothetical protein